MANRRNNPREWSPTTLIDKKDKQRTLGGEWQYIISNPASYPAEIFAHVSLELIFHPERNSKNIRRADILFDSATDAEISTESEDMVNGMLCSRVIRRQLMPRNPNLDPELEQTCRLYIVEGETSTTLITYYCHYMEEIGVPYYVPQVLGVAFELHDDQVWIAYLPLAGKECTDDRLQRVALNLLRTIHRHWYFR